MLMRGDLQGIYDKINPHLDDHRDRLDVLEKLVEGLLEAQNTPPKKKEVKKINKVA